MNRRIFFVLALLVTALLAFNPAKAIAQAAGGPDQGPKPQLDQPANTGQQTDQAPRSQLERSANTGQQTDQAPRSQLERSANTGQQTDQAPRPQMERSANTGLQTDQPPRSQLERSANTGQQTDQAPRPQMDRPANTKQQTDQAPRSQLERSANTKLQTDQPPRSQMERSAKTRQQTDQGVQATVTGVDQPEGCLRIRRASSSSSEIMGCAGMGEKLQLTGIYSPDGRWAELVDKSWVFAAQIDAPNKPKVQRQARRSYESYGAGDSSDTVEFDTPLWREPATSYYETGTNVVYGSPHRYRPVFGFSFGPGRGRHHGNFRGGNFRGGNRHGRR